MANTELILGLAGIGGTLLVSTVGLGSTPWLERRRQAREDRQAHQELRIAARLVNDEIMKNNASVRLARPASGEDSEGLVRCPIPVEQSNWNLYARILATMDDREAWSDLAAAQTAVAVIAANDQRFAAEFAPTAAEEGAKARTALWPYL